MATETLQTLASGLRERHPEDPALGQLDSTIGKLSRERWKAELNLRRVRAAMAVLSNAAARRAAHGQPPAAPAKAPPDARNPKLFAVEEDLFQPIPLPAKSRAAAAVDAIAASDAFHGQAERPKPEPAAAASDAPAAERKRRIVIVRSSNGEIPLANDAAPDEAEARV